MKKKIYWIATGLFSAMLCVSPIMYVLKHTEVAETITRLGFPTWIIYPLAVAKVLGIAAILYGKIATLKEWAYAGFFFNLVLAASAHINVGDGEFAPALAALALLMTSYFLGKTERQN